MRSSRISRVFTPTPGTVAHATGKHYITHTCAHPAIASFSLLVLRRLAELTHQVESSVKEVSSLQGQFSNSLNNNLKERELAIKLKEDQLKSKLVEFQYSLKFQRTFTPLKFYFFRFQQWMRGLQCSELRMRRRERDSKYSLQSLKDMSLRKRMT